MSVVDREMTKKGRSTEIAELAASVTDQEGPWPDLAVVIRLGSRGSCGVPVDGGGDSVAKEIVVNP